MDIGALQKLFEDTAPADGDDYTPVSAYLSIVLPIVVITLRISGKHLNRRFDLDRLQYSAAYAVYRTRSVHFCTLFNVFVNHGIYIR